MKLLRKKRVYAFLLLAILLLFFLYSDKIGEILYPVHYKQEIAQSAAKYNVDPLLVAAIIRVETNFKPDETSKKGAIGIMQLMPETAKWVQESGGFRRSAEQAQVAVDIDMGVWYVSWLLNHYDGNVNFTIAAYNAGQGNVNKWRTTGLWDGSKESIGNIPFGETRHYIQRVLYYYQKYHKIYGTELI
jgi:soluble lytic murein transglycosylase